MPTQSIYFDNNATTPIDPAIARLMFELQQEHLANPASQHRPGRLALRRLEQAKSTLLDAIGAPNSGMDSAHVILTSGGTEANNLAVRGYAASQPGYVIVAASEHVSVLDAARAVGADRCRILPVDRSGICDLQTLEVWLKQLAPQVRLVSVMLGNNETGVIQDIQTICQICQRYSVPVHCDAVQAVGKLPIDMRQLGLSAMSLTAHKLHGPVGIGALVVLPRQSIAPLLHGGGQQLGLRPGTEPVIGAIALAAAVERSCQSMADGHFQRLGQLRDRFESNLAELQPVEFIGRQTMRLDHVSNVAFPGIDRQALQMALDLAGVACSTGSACASGSGRPSHVLTAMGLSESIVASSIRFSFSRFNNPEEVDEGSRRIAQVVRKLRC